MNSITFFLAYAGFAAILFGVFMLALKAVEFWYSTTTDLRICQRKIECLEATIKKLQCNRLP